MLVSNVAGRVAAGVSAQSGAAAIAIAALGRFSPQPCIADPRAFNTLRH